MPPSLLNKVAIVTGAARRIGASICHALHGSGYNLIIHYRTSAAQALNMQEQFNSKRADSALAYQADLLDDSSLPGLINAAVENFGRLDVLVNNASNFYPTQIGEINQVNWNELIGTNLKAPILLAQAAAGELRRRHGCIVNMADIHADRPMKGYVVYSIAKAGLVAATKSLARELGPEVRVNAISPGAICWPENNKQFNNEALRQQISESCILDSDARIEEIANTVLFLARAESYITGQAIAVDGGRSIVMMP